MYLHYKTDALGEDHKVSTVANNKNDVRSSGTRTDKNSRQLACFLFVFKLENVLASEIKMENFDRSLEKTLISFDTIWTRLHKLESHDDLQP